MYTLSRFILTGTGVEPVVSDPFSSYVFRMSETYPGSRDKELHTQRQTDFAGVGLGPSFMTLASGLRRLPALRTLGRIK